ncbi:hypothetical protein ASALC70_01301 [Alcanivorax sp. ALC70]|nr:hypothetical protein ASALC70_01301 [Alcanivorax sp. ALC70]
MPTPTKTINFMGIRKVLGTLSICLVVASIILLATRGLNLGLDFTGGTTVVVEAPADIDIAQVRQDLEEAGFSDAVVQQYGSARDISVRVAPQEGMEADQVGQNVYRTLSGGIDDLQLKQVEFVGPRWATSCATSPGWPC